MFYLFVNNFGIKYTQKEDTNHLLKSLQEDFTITEYWTGEKYLGLTLKWDYVNRNVSVSMMGYVQADLRNLQSKATTKPQYAPYRWNQPTYGAKTQYADTDNAELVDAQSTLYVQQVSWTFLYYVIAVDQTMLLALNTIATAQAHATTTTIGDIFWLSNYAGNHPNSTLHYHASNMILHVARDASYLCKNAHVSDPEAIFSLRPTCK